MEQNRVYNPGCIYDNPRLGFCAVLYCNIRRDRAPGTSAIVYSGVEGFCMEQGTDDAKRQIIEEHAAEQQQPDNSQTS